VLLIVENDIAFARVLLEAARANGFKGVVSTTGAWALTLVREIHPVAVTLDIFLPDMQGWRILDRLKTHIDTRHIPVCVVSTDDARERALQGGAHAFLAKPMQSSDEVNAALSQMAAYVERSTRRLLVAMAPGPLREQYLALLDEDTQVRTLDDPTALEGELDRADALVLDAAAMPLDAEQVADAVLRRGGRQLPVIVLGETLSGQPQEPWRRHAAPVASWTADSLQALLAHTVFCLHRSPSAMTDAEREAVEREHGAQHSLVGKKALIVDDDMRNIFALATVLADEGMVIVSAESGRDAIREVANDDAIDVVLMDIMMPEMDGMQTMREIRKMPRGRSLPMIAVTAKAMKGDRRKCIEAGAWDYVSKPVDRNQLLSVLRGWLCH
jgi:CheY-like chemotaxis protein